jgi:hypothetical protein
MTKFTFFKELDVLLRELYALEILHGAMRRNILFYLKNGVHLYVRLNFPFIIIKKTGSGGLVPDAGSPNSLKTSDPDLINARIVVSTKVCLKTSHLFQNNVIPTSRT